MKNLDSVDGLETQTLLSGALTRIQPLWNYPKTIGVAQALLPVRFSGHCKPLLDTQGKRSPLCGERKVSEAVSFCQVTIVGALP